MRVADQFKSVSLTHLQVDAITQEALYFLACPSVPDQCSASAKIIAHKVIDIARISAKDGPRDSRRVTGDAAPVRVRDIMFR